MATYELRPMSTGEILDGSFALLRRHFGILLGISVVSLGFPAALGLYVQLAGGLLAEPLLWAGHQLLQMLGYLLLSGATVRVVSETLLGNPVTMGEALRFALGKTWRLFVAGLAAGLVTFFALLLLIVPGVIVLCGYAVAVQAVVLEPLPSSLDALGRSWDLTNGFKGKVFVIYFVLFVLVVFMLLGLSFVMGLATAAWPAMFIPSMVLMSMLLLLLYPLSSCVFTLVYYDLRVRKEAFDLEMLSRALSASPGPA